MSKAPNFLVIGAAKCGTTSLAHYLSQHPQVFISSVKEPHFFDSDEAYAKGIDFYIDVYFKRADGFAMRGEATPAYFSLPEMVIPRIKSILGEDLFFIVLLRDPVARAWSHYLHRVRSGAETLSFEDALEVEPQRLIAEPASSWFGYYTDGLYARSLRQWFDAFPRERFLILFQTDLANGPKRLLQEIWAFLKVDDSYEIQDFTRKNKAAVLRSNLLNRFLVGDLYLKRLLKRFFPPRFTILLKRRLIDLNKNELRGADRPILEAALEQRLRKSYLDEILELENMLQVELDDWKGEVAKKPWQPVFKCSISEIR